MADLPEFGRRRPQRLPDLQPEPAPKRSRHVALLIWGTFAVGGGAYALMERGNCQPPPPAAPGVATPAPPQGACASRGSLYSGYHSTSGRWSSFYGGNSTSGSAGGSDASSGSVSRGGFGSLAHAFGFGGG